MKRLLLVTMTFLSACAGGVGGSVDVEMIPPSGAKSENPIYAAKFLCGPIEAGRNLEFPAQPNELLVPGTYLTAINVANSNPHEADFSKMAIQTISQRDRAKKNGFKAPEEQKESLRPYEGLEVDCVDIWRLLGEDEDSGRKLLRGKFVKGFVIIRSELPLDVVGVYSFKNVERMK